MKHLAGGTPSTQGSVHEAQGEKREIFTRQMCHLHETLHKHYCLVTNENPELLYAYIGNQ